MTDEEAKARVEIKPGQHGSRVAPDGGSIPHASAKSFARDLEAVFEERAGEFSSELIQLLEKLYDQGVLEGRARERPVLPGMPSSKLSECGRYWCVPLPKAMLVLKGAQAGAERFEKNASQRTRVPARQPTHPWKALLLEMDGVILEKLANESLAFEHSRGPGAGDIVLEPAPGNVLATVSSAPRVPHRQPANLNPWTFHITGGVDLGIGRDYTGWTKQLMMGTFVGSPTSSTAGSSKPSATALPPAGKSGSP